jgi:hypothetical protein
MKLAEFLDGISCMSLRAAVLAVRKPSKLRPYLAFCLKRYDELSGAGLPEAAPVKPSPSDTITLPSVHTGGGTSFAELVVIARVTKALRPRTVFEIGSYDGLTTAVFILNAPPETRVYSLDLPLQSSAEEPYLHTDRDLVASRTLGSIPRALGLNAYTQILCDSMQFDPAQFAGTVDLGFIDGAHDEEHARNDTVKMSKMMSNEGMILWHDYGGKGTFRPLAKYLESLGRQCGVYRIMGTTLAWAMAKDLKKASL